MQNEELVQHLQATNELLDKALKKAYHTDKGDWFSVAQASGVIEGLIAILSL